MKIQLHVWRQESPTAAGSFETHVLDSVSPDMSFLEMLDSLNEQLIEAKKVPVDFDHDCREGICGSCSLNINGVAHGPQSGTTACQLHMRSFKDGDDIYVEPWRANAFPVLKDLITDRSGFDRIMQSGGFVSVSTAGVPDANAIPVAKQDADEAMDAATCIGCGACVAACKNSSAMLFVSAKVSQLALLPQGAPERGRRVQAMIHQMDQEGFGHCSNTYECEAVCPKEISVRHIARLNREYFKACFFGKED
ncbi:MAG: succinate dehydrogenase/fumarate reductase iron-sulfur subunit [Zetaproteobacteria bacterium]|nr:succinate dehydrogenase/fumarate reductase iron-sulfur subunit [Zetaproteobacteria bacterium]